MVVVSACQPSPPPPPSGDYTIEVSYEITRAGAPVDAGGGRLTAQQIFDRVGNPFDRVEEVDYLAATAVDFVGAEGDWTIRINRTDSLLDDSFFHHMEVTAPDGARIPFTSALLRNQLDSCLGSPGDGASLTVVHYPPDEEFVRIELTATICDPRLRVPLREFPYPL